MEKNREFENMDIYEDKKSTKSKKITGTILSSILFLTAVVGSAFGIYSSVKNLEGVDDSYNDYVQIEANVDINDPKNDINDVSRTISDTLEFLGMQNATIRTLGDDKIVINNPLTSYSYSDFIINPSVDDHFDFMSSSSDNDDYLKEASTLLVPLFFDGTLDIRDTEGDAAFIRVGDDQHYQFAGGVDSSTYPGDFGVEAEEETETETESTILTSTRSIDMSDYEIDNFFGEASIKHSNGYPLIEMSISKEGTNGDGYINMFKDLDQYIDETESTDNPTQYVVWFNYALTYDLVELIDPDGLASSGDLYTYVSSNSVLRPLYLTTGTTSIMSSKYSDTVEFTGTYTEQQAQYFVNRINNSNDYTYSNIKFEVQINMQSKVMLIVLASLLIVFILVVIFAFVGYFGLLGLIASSIVAITSTVMMMLLSSSGILLTGLGLIAIGVIIASVSMMSYQVMNLYKENNEDKFISVTKVFTGKFGLIQSRIFSPIVTTVLLFYGAGLVVPTLIAIPLDLIVIGIVVAYLFVTLLLVPIIYLIDLVIKWTRDDIDRKWDWISGYSKSNIEFKHHGFESTKKSSLIGTIITVLVLIVTVGAAGIYYGTTGSAVNSNSFGTQSYSYVVEPTASQAWLNLLGDDEFSGANPWGASMAQTHYEATVEYVEEVETAFEDNGIKVSSIEVIRVDDITAESDSLKLIGGFGFEIYSKDAITTESAAAINEDLSAINVTLNEEVAAESNTEFELSERMSWNGKESIKLVGYTETSIVVSIIWALVIMIIVLTLILLFVGNWGIALVAFITSIMESILLLAPLFIFFIPFSSLVALPILLLAGLSFRNKITITKRAKNDEVQTGAWKRAADQNGYSILIISAFLLIMELLLIGTYSVLLVIPMLVVTLLAPLSNYLIQSLIFPHLASKLNSTRNKSLENKIKNDIELAKNSKENGELREELIDGVNM